MVGVDVGGTDDEVLAIEVRELNRVDLPYGT